MSFLNVSLPMSMLTVVMLARGFLLLLIRALSNEVQNSQIYWTAQVEVP